MVPTSPRKLQSGSGPVTSLPEMSGPPPKNADGPSAFPDVMAKVPIATTGMEDQDSDDHQHFANHGQLKQVFHNPSPPF